MSANYSIEYSIGTYYDEDGLLYRWFAIDDETGDRIGEMYVDIDRQIIMAVDVIPERRHEGIATALYDAADAILDNLMHAPEEACTAEGLAFSEYVGGDRADDMAELHQ